MYSCESCPFMTGWQNPEEFNDRANDTEEFDKVEEEEEMDNMYRRPPFVPGPYGPRPFYPAPFYPRPFYPGPFYPPRPFVYPAPFYPRPFFGAPFLTGLALGGLLF